MTEMTPEMRKKAVLGTLLMIEKRLEGRTIENLLIDMDFKVEPTYIQGIDEPEKIDERGLRVVIDFTYKEIQT